MTILPKDMNLFIRELYLKDKLSLTEISARIGIKSATIYRRLRSMQVPMRGRGGPNNTRLKLDKMLTRAPELEDYIRASDMTLDEKADVLGVDTGTIRAWLRAND